MGKLVDNFTQVSVPKKNEKERETVQSQKIRNEVDHILQILGPLAAGINILQSDSATLSDAWHYLFLLQTINII